MRMSKKNDNVFVDFEPYIDGSFLKKVVNKVYRDKDFKSFVKGGIYQDRYNIYSGKDYIKFDIASNAAMIHWFDWIPFNGDEEKKANLYHNKEYLNKLVMKTVNQCSFRPLLDYGESIMLPTHIPFVYYTTCLNELLTRKLMEFKYNNPDYQKNPVLDCNVASFRQIFVTISSCLNQAKFGDYSGAYSSLRILIEDYIIYNVLKGNAKAIKEYNKFTEWQQYYDHHGDFPEEYKKIVPSETTPLQYINYGWLRVFDRKSKKAFKFGDLLRYCRLDKSERKELNRLYGQFSKHSHGTILDYGTPEKEIPIICSFLSQLLIKITDLYCEAFNDTPVWNGANLEDFLRIKINEMYEALDNADMYKIKE